MVTSSPGESRGPPPGYLGASWDPEDGPPLPASRGERRAVLRRAVEAWQQGKPGTAWDILREANMESHWTTFRQAGLATARDRFQRAMDQYRPQQ